MVKTNTFISFSIGFKSTIHIPVVYGTDPKKWKELLSYRKQSENFDYDCRFDEKGRCKNRSSVTPGGCCGGCFGSIGYLTAIRTEDVLYYTSMFEETGFWRKDIGCILPREMRSCTCLAHNCNYTELGSKINAWGKKLHEMERSFFYNEKDR